MSFIAMVDPSGRVLQLAASDSLTDQAGHPAGFAVTQMICQSQLSQSLRDTAVLVTVLSGNLLHEPLLYSKYSFKGATGSIQTHFWIGLVASTRHLPLCPPPCFPPLLLTPLPLSQVELLVGRLTNVPAFLPFTWQRSINGILMGAVPHALENALGFVFDFADGGDYYARKRHELFRSRHPSK